MSHKLGEMGLMNILVEGGAESMARSWTKVSLINFFSSFPQNSGRSAIAWIFGGRGVSNLKEAVGLKNQDKKDWRRYTPRRVLGMGNKVMFTES